VRRSRNVFFRNFILRSVRLKSWLSEWFNRVDNENSRICVLRRLLSSQ
jgi:hypothetical protein